jgi:hypothetical protein
VPHVHLPTTETEEAAELRAHIHEATGRDPSPLFGVLTLRPDLARPLFDWFAAVRSTRSALRRPAFPAG